MTQRGPFFQGGESQTKILSIGSQMLNSARQINNLGATSINKVTTSTDNLGINQAQVFLQHLIDKVRDFMQTKVRMRDPLDDNAPHLIPSSRIVTAR